MALGGSFGSVGGFGSSGGAVSPINTGAVDAQGRRSGDLGFARFFPGSPSARAGNNPIVGNWWQANNVKGQNNIPGATVPSIASPQVDFFKQYGGYEGLFGLAPGTFSTPGSFKLSNVLGMPKQPSETELQYSPQAATQNQAQMLGSLVNGGRSNYNFSNTQGGSPLSPPNTSGNTKGPTPTDQAIKI